MGENPCQQFEDEFLKASEVLDEARTKEKLDNLPPVTDPLDDETPPHSETLGEEFVVPRRKRQDAAARLQKCYEENNVPQEQQVWRSLRE